MSGQESRPDPAPQTINKAGESVVINTHGRHDPCVGIRATPIAEAYLALVLIDHALIHRAQNADVVVATPKVAATVLTYAKSAQVGRHDDPLPNEA